VNTVIVAAVPAVKCHDCCLTVSFTIDSVCCTFIVIWCVGMSQQPSLKRGEKRGRRASEVEAVMAGAADSTGSSMVRLCVAYMAQLGMHYYVHHIGCYRTADFLRMSVKKVRVVCVFGVRVFKYRYIQTTLYTSPTFFYTCRLHMQLTLFAAGTP